MCFRRQAGSYRVRDSRSVSLAVLADKALLFWYERALRLIGLRFSCVEIG